MIWGGDNGLELAMREIGCWRSGKRYESVVAVTTLITAYGVCLLLLLRRTEYVYYFCYGIRSMPTTFVAAYGVCLLLLLRHTEYAYYF